jgi:HEAT repeat protein
MWRFLPEVRGGERERVFLFAGTCAGINLAQTVGLAGAEAILLGRLGAAALPPVFVLAALVTVVGMLAYSAVVGTARNDRLMVTLLGLAAGVMAVGFALVRLPFAWAPPALLCAWFLAQAVLMNHLFTFATDYFDTLASKRVVPLLAVGGSVGGALGGAGAAITAGAAPPEVLVAVWALLLAATALFVVAFRGRLARWRALALDEADEASFQGIVVAWRYARRSKLSRWLTASVLAMIVALFVSQYLYSEIFVRSFGSTEALAIFLGVYLAASNLLELAVELAVAPWLIRRYGVASANVAHAVTTLASFLALALNFRLTSAIGARLNREMLDNALSQPIRHLVYNALPLRVRGRMRAFLEGIVLYSGMAAAGVILLAVPAPDPRLLAAVGALVTLVYLAATLRARGAYLEALVDQLREGSLDFSDVGEGLSAAELSRLGALWSDLLATEGSAAAAAELAPHLAARGVIDPLERGTAHPDAGVRRACVTALAKAAGPRPTEILRAALADADAEVRRLALVGLGAALEPADLERGLADPDPVVRATAAARHGAAGAAMLAAMVGANNADEAQAALDALPAAWASHASPRLADPDARVRAAALRALARSGQRDLIRAEALAAALEDREPDVRRAAVEAADALLGEEACAHLAARLDDSVWAVRRCAADALARRGERGVAAAQTHLSGRPWTAAAAARAVAGSGTATGRTALARALRRRVDSAWENALALRALGAERDETLAGLAAAQADALVRDVRVAFRLLRQLEGAQAVSQLERALRLGTPRRRGDALEVLSNLGDRQAAGRLALLLEPVPLGEKRLAFTPGAPAHAGAVLERARQAEDRWVRMAASEAAGDVPPEERLLDRLLALRRIPLFAQLSLDQLESVNRAMQVEHYTRGEVVVREGERGDKLFLLLEGEVEIWAGWGSESPVLLNRLSPVSSFGERAVLNDEVRTATAVTAHDSLLASLDGERMKELIRRMPDISFAIFRELIDRARVAEERLRRLSREEPA